MNIDLIREAIVEALTSNEPKPERAKRGVREAKAAIPPDDDFGDRDIPF